MLIECHIQSRFKPTVESKANLVILTYGPSYIFVRTPKTYQDLETVARGLFNLGKTDIVSFEVPEVEICGGNAVKISEGAWEELSALVSVVVVRVKSASQIRRARLSGTGLLLTPSTTGTPFLGGIAERDIAVGYNGERVKDENVSVRLERFKATSTPDADGDTGPGGDQWKPTTTRLGFEQRESGGSHRGKEVEDVLEGPNGAAAPEGDDDGDGKSNPARIALPSESGSEDDADGEGDGDDNEDDDHVDEDQDIYGGKDRQEALNTEHDHEQATHKPVIAKQEEEVMEEPNTQVDQLDYVEDKFIVEVHHSVKGKRKFRVRARHHVSKLIAAVCQDFELDKDRAHLMLIVGFEENGVVMEHDFECDENETIGQCGIKQGSRLVIRIDDED